MNIGMNLNRVFLPKEIKLSDDKEKIISLCESVMNNSTIYDRNIYKNRFKEIYNKNKFYCPLDNYILSNIMPNGKIKV